MQKTWDEIKVEAWKTLPSVKAEDEITVTGSTHQDVVYKIASNSIYIENTEKVKWAMNKMKRDKLIENIEWELNPDVNHGLGLIPLDLKLLLKGALEELRKPEKFDPIEHMRNGTTLVDRDGVKVSFDGDNFKCVGPDGIEHVAALGFLEAGILKSVIKGEMKLYVEPEPTPQELIDDARNSFSHGSIDPNCVSIDKVIDAYEKLIKHNESATEIPITASPGN